MSADLPTLTIARLTRVLENHGTTDLSLPQYRVLGLLSSGHERAGDLAARLAVTKPTLTALVDGLVERGYVVRETPSGDRRAVRVSITDAGRAAAERAGQGFRRVLDEVLGHCADPDAVLVALDQLRVALDARWEARAAAARPAAAAAQAR
jgi:DNA-binding MarR family transcriptional regulator